MEDTGVEEHFPQLPRSCPTTEENLTPEQQQEPQPRKVPSLRCLHRGSILEGPRPSPGQLPHTGLEAKAPRHGGATGTQREGEGNQGFGFNFTEITFGLKLVGGN